MAESKATQTIDLTETEKRVTKPATSLDNAKVTY